MPAQPGAVRLRQTGDIFRRLVPENPAGEATPGREQSAGYARRRHLMRDCGRGFDSRRLHWFKLKPTIQDVPANPAHLERDLFATRATSFAGDSAEPGAIESQASRGSGREASRR